MAFLSGDQEVPPADPDGTGIASMTFDPESGRICYTLHVSNIAGATLAHIHRGVAGVNGGIVVHLSPPNRGGRSGTCTEADPALVAEIVGNPEGFYVNVHNPTHQGGAVRSLTTTSSTECGRSRPGGPPSGRDRIFGRAQG